MLESIAGSRLLQKIKPRIQIVISKILNKLTIMFASEVVPDDIYQVIFQMSFFFFFSPYLPFYLIILESM